VGTGERPETALFVDRLTKVYEDGMHALDAPELQILSGQFKSVWKDVAQADNAGEAYQGSTRLSSQVTTSHCESGYFGATRT
jgi:hypothetical protein